jgi:hypothetical protein
LDEDDEALERDAQLLVLGIELLADVEDARRVEGDQQQDGGDAQPVDVVAPGPGLEGTPVHDIPPQSPVYHPCDDVRTL